jgi:hypothetical protein
MLQEKITQEIKSAMLQKNAERLRGLRGIKAQLDLLNTLGKEVTSEMELSILQKMVKQRKESAEIFKNNGRTDLLEVELQEISVIEEFLPKQMSREEIEASVKEIVASLNATSFKEMGKVMGVASKTLAGKADNKIVSEVIKSLLS